MNESIVNNWNSKIQANNQVYLLGDVSFGDKDKTKSILKRLNGKIYLVKGNHDKLSKMEYMDRFEWIKDYHELFVQDPSVNGGRQMIILCHYAFLVWNRIHHGSWSLFGHSHNNLKFDDGNRRMDVGVDTNNYFPYSYQNIKNIMTNKTFNSYDHHDGL